MALSTALSRITRIADNRFYNRLHGLGEEGGEPGAEIGARAPIVGEVMNADNGLHGLRMNSTYTRVEIGA
jgi:hypothetical protein